MPIPIPEPFFYLRDLLNNLKPHLCILDAIIRVALGNSDVPGFNQIHQFFHATILPQRTIWIWK
jgi:hypothetical protein